mgnify:CR=1 FL=1
MAQIVFKRHEKKYLLTGEQYQRLMLVLNGVMDMDVYGPPYHPQYLSGYAGL